VQLLRRYNIEILILQGVLLTIGFLMDLSGIVCFGQILWVFLRKRGFLIVVQI
jgi:hypothetical protein